MQSIKIFLAEDMDNILDYFKMVLSNEPDMEVVGTANSAHEAIKLILSQKPDVVLIDVEMETPLAGIDAIECLSEQLPQTKFIVLTIHEDDETLFKAFAAGATDFIIKTASIADIVSAVRDVFHNRATLNPNIAQKIKAEFSRLSKSQDSLIYTLNIISKLTSSEFDILNLIYQGNSYTQIANLRYVTEGTVRVQANRILKKFKKSRMKDVVALMRDLNILNIYDQYNK